MKTTQDTPKLHKNCEKWGKNAKAVVRSHSKCIETVENSQKSNKAPNNGQTRIKMWKPRRKATQTSPKSGQKTVKKLNETRSKPSKTPQSCPKAAKTVEKMPKLRDHPQVSQ